LKGTRLAIDRLGDTSDFRARKVLEAIGILPQKEVFLLQIGGQGARFAALKSGQVQSMIVDPPLTLGARKAGFRELVKMSQLAFPPATASIVVMKATGDRRGQEVYGALRAIMEWKTSFVLCAISKPRKGSGFFPLRFARLKNYQADREN
jgi:ABC-type nitrate/sulfonate/bicarbonate transport system substrate-binding protein